MSFSSNRVGRAGPALALALLVMLPGCTQFQLDRARLHGYDAYRAGDHRAARDYFTRCVEGDPTDWKSSYYLGVVLLEGFDEPGEALRRLEVADEIRRSRPELFIAPRAGTPETAVPFPTPGQIADAMAEAMFREGSHDRLVTYLRNTANEYGGVGDYVRLAKFLERLDDHDGARQAFQTAARVSPKGDASAYVALADFLDRVGDREAALTALRRGYSVNPDDRALVERIRAHGAVPGPTFALPVE